MKSERAAWTYDKDKVWLSELVHQANVLGKRSQSGFKKDAWNTAVTKLNETFQVRYERNQLKSRLAMLKKDYDAILKLRNMQGVEWNPMTGVASASNTVWDACTEADLKLKKWRNTTFPLFSLMDQLYSGSSGTPPPVSPPSAKRQRVSTPSDDISTNSRVEQNEQADTSHMKTVSHETRQHTQEPIVLPATRSKPELAVMLLQDEHERDLSETQMVAAFNIMLNAEKAAIFLVMKPNFRKKWILDQISASV